MPHVRLIKERETYPEDLLILKNNFNNDFVSKNISKYQNMF